MVVALEPPVDGEVLLDDARAERHGGDRHVEAALVAGVADRCLGELGEPRQVGEVDVLEGRRVGRLAVQERVGDPGAADDVDGLADLALGGHAGGDDHGRAAGGHVAEQRVVGHVRRGDLERGDAVVDEPVDADRVPRGAHDVDADVLAVVEDLEEAVGAEVVLREEVEGVLRAEVLAARAGRALAVDRLHVAQLELHDVGAGLDRQVDELLGQRHVALVVDADLGDQQRGGVGGHDVAPDAQLVGPVDRDRDQVAAVVDERDVVDPGAEGVADLGGAAADRQAAWRGVGGLERRDVYGQARSTADPAAEVAVGQHAVEVAVGVDEEDHPRLVGGDLLQGPQHRVARVDDVGREVTLDDQRWAFRSWCGPHHRNQRMVSAW
ncbi:unannotated protein [freshwater metagenome]|uniref:Unannotated protein n=1 Tax=freshwater metagenome TaxID=449393 RepID=A0A6J7J3Y3_9ZZZZ